MLPVCCGVQNGQAPLSDLQCTTSSEALLAGKAPTFRLLVWAIDRHSGGVVGTKQATDGPLAARQAAQQPGRQHSSQA